MHVCVRVCVYDIMSVRMFDVRVYVCEKEREKERREGPKGMEKPIPSYQRKWLLADRKERCTFSAEDDNNKRLRTANSKLVAREPFYNRPLNSTRYFNIRHPFSTSMDYGSPWLTFVALKCGHNSQHYAGDEFFRNF